MTNYIRIQPPGCFVGDPCVPQARTFHDRKPEVLELDRPLTAPELIRSYVGTIRALYSLRSTLNEVEHIKGIVEDRLESLVEDPRASRGKILQMLYDLARYAKVNELPLPLMLVRFLLL